MRLATAFLVPVMVALGSFAQTSPPRTPGRVGGSPNNPSVLRPRVGAVTRAGAPLDVSTALNADEQKQYQLACQFIPDLTVYDFFQIEYLVTALHDAHIETDAPQLAKQIAAKKNHVTAALRQLGVPKADVRTMYRDAVSAADKRTEQVSK